MTRDQQVDALAYAVDAFLNEPNADRKVGFAVLVFDFGDKPTHVKFVSNAARDEMVRALKHFVAQYEARQWMN